MSCYRKGDMITYRVAKRRGAKGHHVLTGTVIEYRREVESVLVRNHALWVDDLVPVETITMHQPSLLAG